MPPASASASDAPPPIEQLDLDACRAILARNRLCTMSIVDGDVPYAVPLFYGFDGATLHLGLSEGRKTRALDANPRVCFVVTELGDGDAWASVQITGTIEWMDGSGREESLRVLMEHNRRIRTSTGTVAARSPDPSPAPPRRHGTGRLLRVVNPSITGRARR